MKTKLAVAFVAIILVGAVGYIYFSKRKINNNNNLLVLRIPDAKFMGLLPLYVAEEKGFFATHNIKVQWVDVIDPGQAEKAFLAGHADVHGTTFANALLAEVRQPGTLKLLVPAAETSDKPGSYVLVNKDSKIHSVDDLRGKKIGTYSGPSQKAYAQIFLSKQGLQIDTDYQLIQVSSSTQVQSLLGGAFDALFTVEPYGSVAISQGAKVLVYGVRTKYIANPFWVGAFVAKSDYANNSDHMRKIISALAEAIAFIKANEAASREVLAKRTDITPDVAQKCQLYNWVSAPTDDDIKQMQSLIDLLTTEKLLSKSVDVKPLIYRLDRQ
jgi:NitT/TauT family transport system substrate-binding protein